MYRSHWRLSRPPFCSRLDPGLFYRSPTHEEALARLHFLVETGRRLGLLAGGGGSGKSMVLSAFAGELRRSGADVALVGALGLDAAELLTAIAEKLGLNPTLGEPAWSLWRAIDDRLVANRYQHLPTVVLLDDADEAGADAVAQMTRLAKSHPSPEARLSLVLSANIDQLSRLPPRLLELGQLRIELEPWDAADTAEFVKASLDKAGGEFSIFDDDALACLYELSGGVPRRVSQLAELALVAGAGQKLQRIDRHTIETVCRELDTCGVRP